MSKRRKASIIVTGKKRAFSGNAGLRLCLIAAGTTGGAGVKGTVYAQVGTTGVAVGSVFIAINTASTGTKINA